MDRPARLYLCVRCRVQVVLCSHCDRGNRYCGRTCRRQARAETQRQAARRYQGSRRGRMAQALRTRHWRRCQATDEPRVERALGERQVGQLVDERTVDLALDLY
jgi:hypothetical protein